MNAAEASVADKTENPTATRAEVILSKDIFFIGFSLQLQLVEFDAYRVPVTGDIFTWQSKFFLQTLGHALTTLEREKTPILGGILAGTRRVYAKTGTRMRRP
jgi:hypothetical protein